MILIGDSSLTGRSFGYNSAAHWLAEVPVSLLICITMSGCRCRGVGRVGVMQVYSTSASINPALYSSNPFNFYLTLWFYWKKEKTLGLRQMPEKDFFGQKRKKKSSLKINLKGNFGLVSSSFYQPLLFILDWCFKIGDMQLLINCLRLMDTHPFFQLLHQNLD